MRSKIPDSPRPETPQHVHEDATYETCVVCSPSLSLLSDCGDMLCANPPVRYCLEKLEAVQAEIEAQSADAASLFSTVKWKDSP